MIFDDFKNLKNYNIDNEVVDFILNMDSNIPLGHYEINDNAYINVQEYKTRDFIKLEAHKKYIDIQFLLNGEEIVYVTDLSDLTSNEGYNSEKDIIFYNETNKNLNKIYLTKNKFLFLDVDDAHSPCTSVDLNNPILVKKAVVKIKK